MGEGSRMGTAGSQNQEQEQAGALARRTAEAEGRYQELFTAIPHGLIHFGADGSIIDANPAACEILGLDRAAQSSWPEVPPGQAVHEDGSPFALTDLPMRAALRTGAEAATVVVGIPSGRTGELRWLRVTTVPAGPDEHGHPREGYAIFTDLTQQRRRDAALQESTGLLQRLRESNVLGVVAHTERGIYDANDSFLELIGASRADLESGRLSYQQITPPEWADRDRDAVGQLRRNGAFQP